MDLGDLGDLGGVWGDFTPLRPPSGTLTHSARARSKLAKHVKPVSNFLICYIGGTSNGRPKIMCRALAKFGGG